MNSFFSCIIYKNIIFSYRYRRQKIKLSSKYNIITMKIKYLSFLFILLTYTTSSLAGDYPKSRVETEMDEMGSLIQGEGIVFRPGKTIS